MNPRLTFQKALYLLDRGRKDEAEAILRQTIVLAEQFNDEISLGQAQCCLGEVLCCQNRIEEAKPILEKVVAIKRDDDLLQFEINHARQLLEEI